MGTPFFLRTGGEAKDRVPSRVAYRRGRGGVPMAKAKYFDVYALPVPKKNLAKYRGIAKTWGRIMRSHGMLEYREMASSGKALMKKLPQVQSLVKPKKGDTVVVSYAGFRNKAHHDRANEAGFKDPRMRKMMEMKPIFDMKRMWVGEFQEIVSG
jgi:uncharacterized protein YbaA (DUF1428 family)